MSDSNGYVCLDKHSRVVANHLGKRSANYVFPQSV